METFPAEVYEASIADALAEPNLPAVIGLLKRFAVEHPYRCEVVLDAIQDTLDVLAADRAEP